MLSAAEGVGVPELCFLAQAGERSVEGNECALTIRLLAAPTYVIVANSVDKDDGLAVWRCVASGI